MKDRPGKVRGSSEMAHLWKLVSITRSQTQSVESIKQAITNCFIGSCWHNLARAYPPEVLLTFLMANSNYSMVDTNDMTETQKL